MPSASASADGIALARLLKAAVLCGVLLLAVTAASDDGLAAAAAAYAEGSFLDCAELAEARGTSAGHALAAKCLAFQAEYLATEDEKPA